MSFMILLYDTRFYWAYRLILLCSLFPVMHRAHHRYSYEIGPDIRTVGCLRGGMLFLHREGVFLKDIREQSGLPSPSFDYSASS